LAYILAKNCPCPDTFWETEFKGDGPINLVVEISRQHSIQALIRILLTDFRRLTIRIGSKKKSRKI
jgi:hypothetical protein